MSKLLMLAMKEVEAIINQVEERTKSLDKNLDRMAIEGVRNELSIIQNQQKSVAEWMDAMVEEIELIREAAKGRILEVNPEYAHMLANTKLWQQSQEEISKHKTELRKEEATQRIPFSAPVLDFLKKVTHSQLRAEPQLRAEASYLIDQMEEEDYSITNLDLQVLYKRSLRLVPTQTLTELMSFLSFISQTVNHSTHTQENAKEWVNALAKIVYSSYL